MKKRRGRIMKSILILSLLFVSLCCTQVYGKTTIVIEAEHFSSITPTMEVKKQRGASGGACIEIPLKKTHAKSETPPSDTGYAEYKIHIPVEGNYQFWARCWWYDHAGNSFFVLVDSIAVDKHTPYITSNTYKKWHWVQGPVFHLTRGIHTIRIQNREDGAKMDQWILTTTPKPRWEPIKKEKETPQYIVK